MVRYASRTSRTFVLFATVLVSGQACSPVQNRDPKDANVSESTRSSSDPNQRGTDTADFVDTRTEINPTPEEVTIARLRVLTGEIEAISNRTGRLPLSLDEILSKNVVDRNLRPQRWWLLDGWDRPIRYTVNSNRYALLSSGADGLFDTPDDLRIEDLGRNGGVQ